MDKLKLIKRNAEEILNADKLSELLNKKNPITYCGYETSGEIHLGHLVTITKLLDLEKAGFKVKVLFADWHTWLNKKGDWDFIHKEIKKWEKGFKAAGLEKADYVLGSSFQMKKEYMNDVFTLAGNTTVNRGLRSMQQVARDVNNAKVSQIIYPLMQIVDIKHLDVDLVQSGIEQRKIHALGIENFDLLRYKKPVFVHTPLISSLKGPGKMSSSEKDSYISIRDDEKEIRAKLKKAYCLAGEVKNNSVLQIAKLIIFPSIKEFKIERDKKYGGDLKFNDYEGLEKEFKE
ncbi:tyrosine--tRNA ligase, partial [archaeon]|nr:tyrosine--tRNA ligase [archaeon]